MSAHITLANDGHVQTLTIDRPEKKNAITQAMYTAMATALEDYGQNDALRALVITGAGDMFTAGNDLRDFAMSSLAPSSQGSTGGTPAVIRFLNALVDCPKPLIAAVNGPGIGIGLTMLLHCDLVYASTAATFSAPFVRLALVPEAASSQLLAQSVGMAVANDILLAGRTLSADEALAHGLVARLFPDDKLASEVTAIAQHIALSSPTALRRSKDLIRHNREFIRQVIMDEARVFADQLGTADFRESAAALMQKRKPVYK